MRRRQFRYRRSSRPRGLLWMLLGAAGLGMLAAVLGGRKRRGGARPEMEPEEPAGPPEEGFYPPEPPESLGVWVSGPAGNLYVRDGGATGDTGDTGDTESRFLPIVFVHSLAGNGGQWALQLDHLRRHRRAVAIDLRGHGESDPAENGDYSVRALAGDVEAVVDQLGLRRFVLAGHSLGATVAIDYASRHPERVAGLLLVDPSGDLTKMPREETEPFLASLRKDPLGELTSYFRQLLVGGDKDAARWVLEDLKLTAETAIVKSLEGSFKYPTLKSLKKYPGPKLSVVSGMNSLPNSLHRLQPDLSTRMMPGAGHWLMMDRPEAFNHIVEEFLDAVEGG